MLRSGDKDWAVTNCIQKWASQGRIYARTLDTLDTEPTETAHLRTKWGWQLALIYHVTRWRVIFSYFRTDNDLPCSFASASSLCTRRAHCRLRPVRRLAFEPDAHEQVLAITLLRGPYNTSNTPLMRRLKWGDSEEPCVTMDGPLQTSFGKEPNSLMLPRWVRCGVRKQIVVYNTRKKRYEMKNRDTLCIAASAATPRFSK